MVKTTRPRLVYPFKVNNALHLRDFFIYNFFIKLKSYTIFYYVALSDLPEMKSSSCIKM